jgi:uncharacterized protein YbbC (DUF1343 family)
MSATRLVPCRTRGIGRRSAAMIAAAAMLLCQTVMGGTTAETMRQQAGNIEKQVVELLQAVKGKRVALVTNPTGVDGKLNLIADRLIADRETTITGFFAPEHGVRGNEQAGGKVVDFVDPITSVPVYSIYGKSKGPSDEQLKGTDVLIFDIQDVGVRFYTFAWSMTYAMEAAARNGIKFIVFDRPNPIGCTTVEGAPNTTDSGLVGRIWPGQKKGVPTRYGLTIGELATLCNEEWLNPKADLKVIKIPAYRRGMSFEDTGRPWVIPSPNMPTLDTAMVYPGMCVFEGSNLNEGRGTTKPFEQIGAPFIDGTQLARKLNDLELPGVRFRAVYYTPMSGRYSKEMCGGVQVHVMDRDKFDPIRTALHVLKAVYETYPKQLEITSYADKLMGVPGLRERIKTEKVEDIIAGWQKDLAQFKKLRQKHLIYPE